MDSQAMLIRLFEDTYAYVGREKAEDSLETFKTQLDMYIELINKLIDSNFEELSDKDLYELLSQVYTIRLDEEDYLQMFSRYYGKDYTFTYTIPTTMTYRARKEEGHGRSFDWWVQDYQVFYKAAISNDFDFDWNKTYTPDEIEALAEDNSIVLMNEDSEEINRCVDFKKEDYRTIDTFEIDIKDYSDNISQFVIEHFDIFGQLLREKYTRKVVLADVHNLMSNLVWDIKQVIGNTESRDNDYSSIALACKEWYDSSEEKKQVDALQRKIKETKN